MKISNTVLIASLALNAGLLVAYLRTPSTPASALASQTPQVQIAPVTDAPKPAPLAADTWKRVGQRTDADFVAWLRSEGFPPGIVYTLMHKRVAARYADRMKELDGSEDAAYWREDWYAWASITNSPTLRKERRKVEAAIDAELRALLGDDFGMVSDYQSANEDRLFGNMPRQKVKSLQKIEQDYYELQEEIRTLMRGVTLPEDHEQLALLEKERQADLAALLTPEELEDYTYRASPLAQQIRQQLAFFDPSEEEFRALVRVQKEFDARYANVTLSSDDSRELREAEVKKVLSADRFQDYQVKTSGSYRYVAPLVERHGLPAETTTKVIRLQRDAVAQGLAIRNDKSLTEAQRAERLNALVERSRAELSANLPNEALTEYTRSAAGEWLARLQPRKPVKKD
jgi:hypothetical protein